MLANDLKVTTPVVGLRQTAGALRSLLPKHRRTAEVASVLLHGLFHAGGIRLSSLQMQFQAPACSLWSRAPRKWTAFVDVAADSGEARLLSSGVVTPQGVSAGPGSEPLRLADLADLEDVLLFAVSRVPPEHRVSLPFRVDLALLSDAGVTRWSLQYEVEGVGFRVLHWDAHTQVVLHDHFDRWQA